MKTYAAVLASLIMTSASVVNAQDTTTTTEPHRISETPIHTESPLAALNADDIEGKDIVDHTGQHLGDIDEVVKDQANQMMVVIGLKGSNKEVVIPLEKLAMTSDRDTLTVSMTRDQLEALPDYDPKDMESVKE